MFTHTIRVKKETHRAHGYLWEIELYKVIEDGSYKIFISTPDGQKGDALFINDVAGSESSQSYESILIEKCKNDIELNEENKYDL